MLQVSNKHLCRWLNDRLLSELAPPMSKEEIAGLFAPPPWGEKKALTPFERITGAGDDCLHDMAAWEPFRNVDMDKETQMLMPSLKPRSKEFKVHVTESMASMQGWQRVERQSREALRRNFDSPLVEALEDKILTYVNSAENNEVLILEAGNPFHRLLLHGICEYYGLVSNTVSKWEDKAGERSLVTRTHINKKKQSESSDLNEPVRMKLVNFLSILKNGVLNSEAAA
ncbi:hypothetical protein SUGI_0110180 [Cryptomeria japonica]|nr:hypothetical protein SUGI_0110180 [Cryptomeria japonica]